MTTKIKLFTLISIIAVAAIGISVFQLFAFEEDRDPFAGESIVVGGSRSVVETIGIRLVDEYRDMYPKRTITMYEASHTGGALEGTDSGILDLGFTSRAPSDSEVAAFPNLIYRVPMRDGLVFVTTDPVSVQNVTTEQLFNIYAGTTTNWMDLGDVNAPIIVFDRSEGSSPKVALREELKFLPENFRVTREAIVLGSPDEMDAALSKTQYSIGYTSYGSIQLKNLPVNMLAIDGVFPSPESIAAGSFPLYREMGYVTAGEPEGLLKDFVDFMYSERGRQLMSESGFVPLFD